MSVLLYLIFGFLDVIANLALIYKIYRFPFWEYRKEFLIIGATLSVVSYLMRIVFDAPEMDMIVQFVLYILFFRYLIRIQLYYAFSLAAIGYLGYTFIQFSVYPVLMATGIASLADALTTNGLGIYLVQFSTEIMCYLIAYFIYRMGWGFSHITRPPHAMSIKVDDKHFGLHIAANMFGTTVIVSVMYWVFNHTSFILVVWVASLLSLLALMYLSYRKDYVYYD